MTLSRKVSILPKLALSCFLAAAVQSTSSQSSPGPQQAPAATESATVLKATTRLVVVDVVATDGHGHAITNLERKDFKVLEDGQEQDVRVFGFREPVKVAPGETAASLPKLADNIFTNVPRYETRNALNVLLLDALNTTLPHQAYVRNEMIRYIEKMPEGQPVAVYALGTKLTLLQDFTSDPQVLRKIVKDMKHHVSPLLDSPAGGPPVETLPPGLADSGVVSDQMLQALTRFEAERSSFQTDLRVSRTLDALNAISHSLAGYPGRKNLIWISEAFPIYIGPSLDLNGDIFAGLRSYGSQIDAASDALISAQIAIYPVDARGLEVSSEFDASRSGRDAQGRSLARNPGRLGTALSNESAALQAAHGAMQEMAQRTGGKAYYNRNDIDGAVRDSITDGSTYYTLAYYPANKKWDGKFRKIRVIVDRPEVKVHYRLGYYAMDPTVFPLRNEAQQAAELLQAISPDSPLATGLLFEAAVFPPSQQTRNQVQVDFSIDARAIGFDHPSDGLHRAGIECVAQAYSAKGKLVKGNSSTVNASLKPATYAKVMAGGFPCSVSIDLPGGDYGLRLGVRDIRTGLIGTANARVNVPQTSTSASVEKKTGNKKP
jgi:VWFA-related protein